MVSLQEVSDAPPPFATKRNNGLTELSGPLGAPFSKYKKSILFLTK
jgi:hypothetical protein